MRPLDRTDLALLRAIGVYPFHGTSHGPDAVRPAALARRLGLGVDLVKDRLARMEDAGIILGYQVHPNLHHLGLQEAVLHLEVAGEARERFHEEAAQMDGVVGLCRYVGDAVCLEMHYASPQELERKTRQLVRLSGHDAAPGHYVQAGPHRPTRRLTNLDWRILRALRGDARQPLAQVAEAVDASPRTVRRRLDRMAGDHAIDVVVEPDFGAVTGAIVFVMRVQCAGEVTVAVWDDVLAVVQDRCFLRLKPAAPGGDSFMVDSFAFSQGEVEEVRAAIARVPGVQRVELFFPSSENVTGAWMDEAIEAMVRRTGPALSDAGGDGPGIVQVHAGAAPEPGSLPRTEKT